MKKTKIKGGYLHNGKGKQFTTLLDALANDTLCGCGINCKNGYISLPNFNSVSGDKDSFYGLYISDGELVVDTIANVKEGTNPNCGNGGGGGTQALRLTFDNIENANALVGDASNVADWNTFFDLPTYGNPFTSVEINGTEVSLFGGSNIDVKPGLMYNYNGNTFLTKIIDNAGCIITVGGDSFSYCNGITDVNLPECTIVYGVDESPYSDWGGFGACVSLINLNMPKLVEARRGAFPELYSITSINLPSLTTVGYGCFSSCTSLATLNIPLCTNLGNNFTYNGTFYGSQNITEIIADDSLIHHVDLIDLSTHTTFTFNGNVYQPYTGHTGNLTIEFNNIANATAVISGDYTDVTVWNAFFDLPDWSTPFTSISIVGNELTLIGGENIVIRNNKFQNKNSIINITDTGCIVHIGPSAFSQCVNLLSIDFNNLKSTSISSFGACYNLTTINIPNLLYCSDYSFSYCTLLTTANLSSCIYLGSSSEYNGMFINISGRTITLTVPTALMTADSGSPDGDIAYLQANNTVTIITV